MEGYLTIPPDRGTILGRALWKTRYVVVGSAQGEVLDDGKSRSSISSDGITYLSIYKNPDDWEPSQQYAVSNITSCQVQMVAHRKQGPVLPTLIITITADPATEKLRKRRSSRAATLVSNRDNSPTILWFRTDGEASKLHEWARSIQAASQPNCFPGDLPMSPMSPMSNKAPAYPGFQSPFGLFSPRDASSEFSSASSTRPPSAPSQMQPRVPLYHKASSSLTTHRERPLTLSDAPSLRSRRSDLSSPTDSVANTATTHSHGSILPKDPSAPSEADGELFGWTSAQGRSSTILQSPTRTIRDSLGSIPPLSPAAMSNASTMDYGGSPPGPRETILDRAFQLKYIPGSDQTVPGEEKLSSLARFEALMQQVDKTRKDSRTRSIRPMSVREQLELKSAWEVDDSDEEEDDFDGDDSDDTESESPADRDTDTNTNSSIRPKSRRTATFPARQQQRGPQTPVQFPRSNTGCRSPISLNPEALAALGSGASPDRPRLAHRIHSAMGSLSLGVRPLPGLDTAASPGKSSSIVSSSETSMYGETSSLNPASAYRTSTILEGQERHSMASSNGGKRLSFSEFTRRLSNTGSMLLSSQQQGSGAPVIGDALDGQCQSPLRGEGADRSESCKNWRNSVGMFSNEGGFL
ncbi:unnamed protein product [Discula destructiva]